MLSMDFLRQEIAVVIYRVTVPEGTTVEAVMKPEVWANHVHLLRPDFEAVVKPADGAWRAHIEFRAVGKTSATPVLLSYVKYDALVDVPEKAIYATKYRGPSHRFCVVRKDNGAVERTGFQTEDEAKLWIVGQSKALAA